MLVSLTQHQQLVVDDDSKKDDDRLLFCLVVGCLSYWLFGYAIAWSDGNSFIGWNNWAFAGLAPEK